MTSCRLFLILVLSLVGAVPAYAGLRDAVLGVEGDTALSLVRFDRQPETVTVHTSPAGVEILIEGVSAKNAKISPPDSHLVSAIDVSPIDGGVHLSYHFKTAPVQGRAEIYDHAVMIRVNFGHPLHSQNARLAFKSPPKPNPMATASITHQGQGEAQTRERGTASAPSPDQSEAASHGANPPASHASTAADASVSASTTASTSSHQKKPAARRPHSSKKKPLLDSDVPAPPEPKVHGTGMIRDASAKQMAQSLDKASCAAAQQAIEDDPWALDKLSVYGACIAKEGRTGEAKEVFERLLTFDPEMISAYMGLGSIAQDSGDIKAAKQYYQQALKAGGSDAQAAKVRALLGTLEEKH